MIFLKRQNFKIKVVNFRLKNQILRFFYGGTYYNVLNKHVKNHSKVSDFKHN